MKKILFTEKAPAPVGPYSQAVEFGGFVFCSGQIAINPSTNEVLNTDIGSQTERVMENIKAVLNNSKVNFDQVVKATIFLVDMADFAKVNEVYSRYFTKEFPARSCVAVSALPKGVKVEVEVIAHR